MIGLVLMRGITLTTGNTASLALMLVNKRLEIDFDLSCSNGPTVVTYFIEYSEDLITWFPEVAEENAGKGVVAMPLVLRTLADNNSTSIANNVHFRISCQFKRQHKFARVQMSATSGTVVVNSINVPYGIGPYGSIEVTAAAPPPGCLPIDLHADGTTGAFTLVGASTDPLILASFPYDFTCSAKAHVQLNATVDSKLVDPIAGTPVYPHYGIFVVAVVPPAAQLFNVIPPDVDIPTTHPVDNAFHTFTGTNTIVNPGAPRFVVFAVEPSTSASAVTIPEDYQYKNFIVNVLGV